MAKVKAATSYATDLRLIDFSNLYYGTYYVWESDSYEVSYGSGLSDLFLGNSFRYSGYEPISGTVTAYKAMSFGTALLSITEMSIAATDIVAAAKTSDRSDDFNLILKGLRGNDTIILGNDDDYVNAGAGNDTVSANSGDDTIYGGAGNDSISGGTGADHIFGNDGFDTASYANATAAVTVLLSNRSANRGEAAGDVLSSIEGLVGSKHSDVLGGNASANKLGGEGGNDTLNGWAGNDTLLGGSGNDTLSGGAGADRIDGGSGTDVASYSNATAAVKVFLATASSNRGEAKGDTLTSIEGLIGSKYDDTLSGNAAANRLDGGVGNDALSGGGGNDTLLGGAGNDTLTGGTGADRIDGGTGTDTASYNGAGAAVKVFLATASSNRGEAAGDVLTSIERLIGSTYADTLSGNGSANRLDGGAGNDTLSGGSGDDTLVGGSGRDVMTGGSGRDLFVFRSTADSKTSASDRITDFLRGTDDVDLRGIDARSTASGDQAFTFIGTAGFHKVAGELRSWQVDKAGTTSDVTYVAGDVNGDGKADFQIALSGLHKLASTDFLL